MNCYCWGQGSESGKSRFWEIELGWKVCRIALMINDDFAVDEHFSGSIDVAIVVVPGVHCRLEDISISTGSEQEVWVRDVVF